MKAALVLAGLVRVAHADCARVSQAQAVAAVKALTGATFVEFHKVKTLDTPSAPAVARKVSTMGDEVQLDGRRIDLANVYVRTEHHDYANLAALVGCRTDAAASYDPRSACEKLNDDDGDARRELVVAKDLQAKATGRDRERADAMVKLAQLKIEQAAVRSRREGCHQPAPAERRAPRNDRLECVDNPLAKGC